MLVGWLCFFFFQAEDGIRDLVRSRGLGDVYKRQEMRQQAHRRPRYAGNEKQVVTAAAGHREPRQGASASAFTTDPGLSLIHI